jgi:hypothetical protein
VNWQQDFLSRSFIAAIVFDSQLYSPEDNATVSNIKQLHYTRDTATVSITRQQYSSLHKTVQPDFASQP